MHPWNQLVMYWFLRGDESICI